MDTIFISGGTFGSAILYISLPANYINRSVPSNTRMDVPVKPVFFHETAGFNVFESDEKKNLCEISADAKPKGYTGPRDGLDKAIL